MKSILKIFLLFLFVLNSTLYAGQAGLSDRCLLTLSKITKEQGKYFGIECEFADGKKAIYE